jgi:hypothetical protein
LVAVLTVFILIFGYSTRVLLLFFDNMTEAMLAMIRLLCLDKAVHQMHKLGVPNMKSLESLLGEMGSKWFRYRVCRCTYALAHAAKRMYTSTIWEVCGYVWRVIATAD